MYQAVFEVISGTPRGTGRVAGLISWGYHFKDDYDDGFFVGEVAMDKSANIRSKPAEGVARWWFDRFSTRPLRVFADTPLARGLSVIRSVHMTELRERVDGVRTNAGLVAYPWSESVAPAGPIRAQHFIELRQALNQAYSAAGRQTPNIYRPRFAGRYADQAGAHGGTARRRACARVAIVPATKTETPTCSSK